MDIAAKITEEHKLRRGQSEAVIALIEEGNTIPFIARYRKEATGGLDDETLRSIEERFRYLRNLEERRAAITASIEEQGKLTEELREKLEAAETAARLEDLYRPYKPKRRTRAVIAREKGLAGLAEYLLSVDPSSAPEEEALRYLDEEKGVTDVATALQLARDIIAGDLSDEAELRSEIRKMTAKEGKLIAAVTASLKKELEASGERSVYENYFDFDEALSTLPGHRILAINRGEKEKALTVKIGAPEERIVRALKRFLKTERHALTKEHLEDAAEDAYKRLIAPSIETELRAELTEKAQEGAMKIFAGNLEQLLMQPPMQGRIVLGWDPAFRTGCKLAVCDATGKILETTVIYPTPPQNKVSEAQRVLERLIAKHGIDLISLGNGTASRESERIIADFLRARGAAEKKVSYVIVNEAGASVYSASKLASEEYPDLDVGARSAASIARRLQDPLAELVKIDPKSIGVGQYQHDMDQKRLGEVLTAVVESCVNAVGVDLNTASPSLLAYVSGISKTLAANIVRYREENGPFARRADLRKVPKLGPKAYEQCAGFLRIRDGKEPLDGTAVHPESYAAARTILALLGETPETLRTGAGKSVEVSAALRKRMEEETGVGAYTLNDILEEIRKPGRDPRAEAETPILRSDVMELTDLEPGMELKGTVRNIVDFGAFVDIGVHQDGLVHISELSDRFVKHPLDVVKVGDIVAVRVLSVDEKRKKISLSMKKGVR